MCPAYFEIDIVMEKKFIDLPLGTRFKFLTYNATWVVLETHGYGLAAKWKGLDGPLAGQTICSVVDDPFALGKLMVHAVEDEKIVELNAKINRIQKAAFEMIDMQTDKIAELRSGYVASQACNEKQRVRILELEKK